ncbi:hypothetical protein Syun_000984 [Stephania yunnanensis]|uniref:Uncharacterized protein n=1 Tax=Stephania yunnanensis TaxID=152371 RepID=A0AAP0LII6_9MAGN
MAGSKAVVTREETGSEPLGGARGHGGRRPPIASYQKEKQKIETKVNAPATSKRAQKGVLEDEGSHIAEHWERDLMIARGGSQGEASQFSEDSLGNEEIEEVAMVEATEGHEPHEAPNPQQMKKSKKKTSLLLYPMSQ